jgi:hypothetical protein
MIPTETRTTLVQLGRPLARMVQILKQVRSQRWLPAFEEDLVTVNAMLASIDEVTQDDAAELGRCITGRYGGMGTFGDYVPVVPLPGRPNTFVGAPGTDDFEEVAEEIRQLAGRLCER